MLQKASKWTNLKYTSKHPGEMSEVLIEVEQREFDLRMPVYGRLTMFQE
jgi:hypothetical protein